MLPLTEPWASSPGPLRAGRVTCVAFDSETLISGCSQALVKVWSMDELKCVRTLRGPAAAAITDCALVNGIPVSSNEEGYISLWDVATSSPIVQLEALQPVHALHAHATSGEHSRP